MKKAAVIKVIIGVVVIVSALAFFISNAMKSSWSYYFSVDEFAGQTEQVKNSSLRLAGMVKAGTVVRDLQKVTFNFTLTGEQAELPIKYAGAVPDNFAEGREVLVDGKLDETGTFEADTVITKCESKYKAKLE